MTAIAFSMEWYVGGDVDPGLRRLRMAFERSGAEIKDLGKHVFPRVIASLEEVTKGQFAAEGAGRTGSWTPLKKGYASWKRDHFPGMPILQCTKDLLAALTNSASAKAMRSVTADSMTYGTKGIEYASYHQTGTKNKDGTPKMPARPPLDMGDEFQQPLMKAVAAGIRDAVRSGSSGLLDFEGERYTDEYGTTRQVITGSGGGKFFINAQGGRTYLKRTTSGQTVTRTFGGKR